MKYYKMTLSYQTTKKGLTVDVTRSAVLRCGDTYFTLSDIATFLDDIKKIKNDIKRLAKDGQTIEVELTVSEYKRNDTTKMLDSVNFDRWTYYGIAYNDGIHLDADVRYTTESHDIWIDFEKI